MTGVNPNLPTERSAALFLFRRTAALALAWLISATGIASAEILFQDDFSGSGSNALNGTTPDVTVSSTTWVADTDYAADGSIPTASRTGSGRAAYITLGSLIDDNRGNADAIYTLSVTLNVLDTGITDWEAIGFWPQTAPTDNYFYEDGNAWMLRRGNGELRVFRGLSTANGISENSASPNDVTGEVDLQIVLDLSSWDGSSNYGTVTYLAKLPASSTYTEIASGALDANNDSFGAVGFGGGNVATQLSYFELSKLAAAAPDPFQVVISPGDPSGYDFAWKSMNEKVYDLVSSTDLATSPSEWAVYDPDGPGGIDPYGDILSQGLLTELSGVPGDGPQRFFSVVEKDPPPPPAPITVENLGVGGQNSSEGLSSFASKLSPLPEHMVIYYGLNDALNSSKLVDVSTFSSNLTSMVNQAVAAGVQNIFLVSIHPINESYLAGRHPSHPEIARLQDHLAEYDAAVAQVAANTAASLIDWRTRFLAESPGTTIADATANTADCLLQCPANGYGTDGIHLTVDGNATLADEVFGALQSVAVAGDLVTCIGDSVTYGTAVTGAGTATGNTYPAVLYQALNP